MSKRKFIDIGLFAADEAWVRIKQLIRVETDPQPGQYSFDASARYWHLHPDAKGRFIGQYLDLETEEGSPGLKMRNVAEYKFHAVDGASLPFSETDAAIVEDTAHPDLVLLQTKIAEAYLRIAYPSVHKTIHDDINHPAFRTALEWAEWFITSSRLVLGSRTVRELFIGMIKAAQRDGQL